MSRSTGNGEGTHVTGAASASGWIVTFTVLTTGAGSGCGNTSSAIDTCPDTAQSLSTEPSGVAVTE